MTRFVATSVVRGSHQGESHGGIYLLDFESQDVLQVVDWNTTDIDWQGRGWDRGLRGIACVGDQTWVAASDELFVYDTSFRRLASYRNKYLRHCHEIAEFDGCLYVTSTGFDAVLVFDLEQMAFTKALRFQRRDPDYDAQPFDPSRDNGPGPCNELHLNNVFPTTGGLYVSGLRSDNLMMFNGNSTQCVVSLPAGTHNAQPYADGIVFNDTQADCVRFAARSGESVAFSVPRYRDDELTHTDLDDSRIARQCFGRGLCVVDDGIIAAGSSPSTVALHSLGERKTLSAVNLTMDIRNAIHGLEVWPHAWPTVE
jgi:hypothetical protein